MAGILVLGAIPSGLAGLVTSVSGLYAIRFWIGESANRPFAPLTVDERDTRGYVRAMPGLSVIHNTHVKCG